MPRIVEEHTTTIANNQMLLDFAQECDFATIMPAHAPNGDKTRFQLVQNDRTGDYISAMGGTYELVQHEDVLLAAHDAMSRNGMSIVEGFIKQRPNSFRVFAVFDKEIQVGNDPSPQRLGVVIRNSLDGSTSVEASLVLFRSFCNNGCIFGREDILGGKMKHSKGVNQRLQEGFFDYFDNMDAVLAPWVEKLELAQKVVFTNEDELGEVIAKQRLGKKLTEYAKMRLPSYVEELGCTPYAAYQAATDAISHFRNGQGNGLNGAATDRAQAKAETILLATPKAN